jgi:hypothetical protein
MASEIATYHRMLDEKFAEVAETLADLPAPALLWKPFDESPWKGTSNSLGFTLAHAVSSAVYLLRRAHYAAGRLEWSEVDGDEGRDEFGPANHDPDVFRARVERARALSHELLDRLTPEDLDRSRAHPRQVERHFDARYDVQHAIEHLSQHVGHAQLTRQLWALSANT